LEYDRCVPPEHHSERFNHGKGVNEVAQAGLLSPEVENPEVLQEKSQEGRLLDGTGSATYYKIRN
jgi:hypothetical protein